MSWAGARGLVIVGLAALVGAVQGQHTHGPALTSWLRLGDCASPGALVFTPNGTDQTVAAATAGAGAGATAGCLEYGGFAEQKTGLAKCTGWWSSPPRPQSRPHNNNN